MRKTALRVKLQHFEKEIGGSCRPPRAKILLPIQRLLGLHEETGFDQWPEGFKLPLMPPWRLCRVQHPMALGHDLWRESCEAGEFTADGR